jgi:hypothetical protein
MGVGWLNAVIGTFDVSAIVLAACASLALYIPWFANADSSMRRGALILLATTVAMFWSNLLFLVFRKLHTRNRRIRCVLGTERTGNMVRFAHDDGYLVILRGCSSIANMSQACLCWITISELSGHRRALSEVWWCLLICGSMRAVNVGRMTDGVSAQHYETMHNQIGGAVTNAMILIIARGGGCCTNEDNSP